MGREVGMKSLFGGGRGWAHVPGPKPTAQEDEVDEVTCGFVVI